MQRPVEFAVDLRQASRRKAKIVSIVDRPDTNPDCCGLLVASSNGWILARSTWAKTLPGMESSVIGIAATVCYGAFAFVQRDEDPVLPVGGNVARSPDTSEEEV